MNSSSKWKSSPLGNIPSDWNVEKGDILAEKITKGASPNWQGFSYVGEGVLFVTSENVRDGFLDVSAPKFVEAAFNEKQKNSCLRQGDILINLVGASIGRSCRFDTALPYPANINQAVCLFRPNGTANADYLKHFLSSANAPTRMMPLRSESASTFATNDRMRFPVCSFTRNCWDRSARTTANTPRPLHRRSSGPHGRKRSESD